MPLIPAPTPWPLHEWQPDIQEEASPTEVWTLLSEGLCGALTLEPSHQAKGRPGLAGSHMPVSQPATPLRAQPAAGVNPRRSGEESLKIPAAPATV